MSQATSDGGVFPLNKPRYSYPNRHGWGPNINKKIPQGKNNKGDLPMKKNTMMRIASCLLIAVLMTTCVISGTFAKYTTTTGGTDTARVAYWGFEQGAELEIDLFDNTYTNVASVDVVGDDSTNDNVVAPGTTKTDTIGFTYVNYQTDKIVAPEVAYTFTIDATITGTTTTAFDSNKSFYWILDGKQYQTIDAFTTAIKTLSGEADGSVDYSANNLPTNFAVGATHTIGWYWAYEGYEVTEAFDTYQVGDIIEKTVWEGLSAENQAKATALGDTADVTMGNADTLSDLTLVITITATQKD